MNEWMTMLRAGWSVVQSPAGSIYFYPCPKCPDHVWDPMGPTQPHIQKALGIFPVGKADAAQIWPLQMQPRLKRSGTKLHSSYTSSGHVKGQLFTAFLG